MKVQLTNKKAVFLQLTNPRMLAMRDKTWAKLRQGCTDRMEELADVFGGKQKLSR